MGVMSTDNVNQFGGGGKCKGGKTQKKKKQEKQCSDLFEYKYYAGCLKEHFLLIHLAVAYIFIFALRGQT